jgi:formylglycine-generating enzyme required for sulfatase activity
MRTPRTHRSLGLAAALTTLFAVAACSAAPAAAPSTAPSAGPSTAPSGAPSLAPTAAASTAPSIVPSPAPTPVPSDGQTAGQTRTDAWGIEQVWVPAGTFTMGTDAAAIAALMAADPPPWVAKEFPSEQPAHKVTLTKGFWIDKNEVTNASFAAFKAAGGYTTEAYWSADGWAWVSGKDAARLPNSCQGNLPDEPQRCISWYEAEAYAAWRAGRLPTEAEWEYAARGPKSTVYPWGDTFATDQANVVDSFGPKPVGSYPAGASWVGALDMAGNAMEWVADWLDAGYYKTSPATDPPGPASGTIKVEKGGWWGSNPFVARSAYRHYEDPPTYADKHIGFRIASQ